MDEDSFLSEVSTDSQTTQTDGISDAKLINQHLNYYRQMIDMSEQLFAEGTRSGKDGLARVLRKKWPKKPAVSLTTLAEK